MKRNSYICQKKKHTAAVVVIYLDVFKHGVLQYKKISEQSAR